MTHGLQLAREPFEAIASGRKTIESRLFDKKRKQIQLDDIIVCTNRDNLAQTLQARVIGLLRYRSFTDLFTHNDPTQFDGKNPDWLLQQISQFYSEDEQRQFGVLGIQFELLQSEPTSKI